MPLIRPYPPEAPTDPDMAVFGSPRPGYAELLLRVLAISGYGMWMWLGMALALGVERIGQDDMQMPLLLGIALVSADGLLAALQQSVAHDDRARGRHRRRWSVRAVGLFVATLVPVVLVISLGDGHGHSTVLRLAGVAMMLCSLVSLVYSAHRYRHQHSSGLRGVSASLPASRLVTAWYIGGLWVWMCTMLQGGQQAPGGAYAWILLLLALALLLGLLEGMRWQMLGVGHERNGGRDTTPLQPLRFLAAIFVYLLPCAALLLTERFGGGVLAAVLSVPSALFGKMLEQQVYERALAGGGYSVA